MQYHVYVVMATHVQAFTVTCDMTNQLFALNNVGMNKPSVHMYVHLLVMDKSMSIHVNKVMLVHPTGMVVSMDRSMFRHCMPHDLLCVSKLHTCCHELVHGQVGVANVAIERAGTNKFVMSFSH